VTLVVTSGFASPRPYIIAPAPVLKMHAHVHGAV
jgi:hypothetical protein